MHESMTFGILKCTTESHPCISANLQSQRNLEKDAAWIIVMQFSVKFLCNIGK